jgi:hypothetical protein
MREIVLTDATFRCDIYNAKVFSKALVDVVTSSAHERRELAGSEEQL